MNKQVIATIIAAALLATPRVSQAEQLTYNFSIAGFGENGAGSVTGSFTGEDLNNDGYLSSFLFTQNIDLEGTPFEGGGLAPGANIFDPNVRGQFNEIISATATFHGSFEDGLGGGNPVTTFSLSNDLINTTDTIPNTIIPNDLFFVLNFNLRNGNLLGDDSLEGLLFGEASQAYVLGLGKFLPSPFSTDGLDAPNKPRGGLSFTNELILSDSLGSPCENGATCGVVHSVFANGSGVGGFQLSNGLAVINRVSAPASGVVFGLSLIGIGIARRLGRANSIYK